MGFMRKQQITFFLTSECNLRCVYCYMPKKHIDMEDRIIDLDFARSGLEDFFSSSSSRLIRFFSSGEPTLAFKSMTAIWQIAYKMAGSNLRAELETNGYFSDEIAEWIESHINYLWISCDGFPHLQDKQRPLLSYKPSSEIVIRNVKRFAKSKKLQFGVRATITKENIDQQENLIDYFYSLGVKYVAASPTYFSRPNPAINTPSLLEFAKHFIPAFYKAIEHGMYYQTLLMVNFDEEVSVYCQASIPTPRLTTDGYISCCDWASFGPKYLPSSIQQDLVYGRYNKLTKKIDYDMQKIERIRKRNIEFLETIYCKGCRALRHCAGGCVGKMAAATDNFYLATTDWCQAVLYLFDRIPVNSEPFPFLHP